MSGNTFLCPYCKRLLPDYFVPLGHGRVAVICFECHIEQQDIHPRKKVGWVGDRVREIFNEKMYLAWKLVHVEGLSQSQAAEKLGISQPSLSVGLRRAIKQAIRVRGEQVNRGSYASQRS